MKAEEAIKQFKEWNENGWSKSETPSSEALILAIQALEKQVANNVERLSTFKNIGKCGGCGKFISTRTTSVYCQYCGNKVDWGSEE